MSKLKTGMTYFGRLLTAIGIFIIFGTIGSGDLQLLSVSEIVIQSSIGIATALSGVGILKIFNYER